MKNLEIIELYEVLTRLENNNDLTFDLKTAYAMAYNKTKLEKSAEIIYKFREKILLKYGKEDNNQIIIPNEKIDECKKELDDLMNMETDVKILALNIMDLKNYSLNLNDMRGLQYMITIPIQEHQHDHEHSHENK